MVDPGHGGYDPGASGYGIEEKNVTLKLSKMINEELGHYEGVKVSLTRWDDRYLSLDQRCEIANASGANLFISLHTNSFSNKSAEGFESYVVYGARKNMTNAARKQDIIHGSVMDFLDDAGIRDRGKKEAGFYVLRYTHMSAILFENLFITNPEENALLKDIEFLRRLAQAYSRGIAKAYNLQHKGTTVPENEPVPDYWHVYKNGEMVGFFDYPMNALQSGYYAAKAGLTSNETEVTITYERVRKT
ncbi:N-acetylmuramoyl-L-alanine amidase family protein [Salinithrix halophila]